MNKLYLLLDCNYLCHRARWGMPQDLTYMGSPTTIIYAFLREVLFLQEQFQADHLVFCFDSKSSLRKKIYPEYKAKRHTKEMTEEELGFEIEFRHQIKLLCTTYLPEIGYRNIFRKKGFESDDLIARLAETIHDDDKAVIISSDHDLFQCLSSNVSVYFPTQRREVTAKSFKKEYRISPKQWALVKSITGCKSDNVEGIRRVGEITAIRYVLGELKKDGDVCHLIEAGKGIIERNKKLVTLPFEGCPILKLQKDELTEKGWKSVCERLGFSSLVNKYSPFTKGRRRI